MKIFILLLALSFSAVSGELIIKNTNFVKLERQHQFRVDYKNDNGQTIDVTYESEFSVDAQREIGTGRYIFSLPRFNRGETIFKTLKVSYQDGSETIVASKRFTIDPTPDYIQINGPFYLRSNGFYQFRAYGYYGGRAYDLSNNGNWMAFRGFAMNSGMYRAPLVNRGINIQDTLIFTFGRGRFSKSLTITAN